MKKLRLSDYSEIEKVGLLFAGIFLLSIVLSNPTAMVAAGGKSAIIDTALANDNVKNFLKDNPDFHIMFEKIPSEKLKFLEETYPNTYSNLPDNTLYQVIFDANNKAMVVILSDDFIYKTIEVDL